MSITLKEIAKISGFGYGTVSRALSNEPHLVKEETRAKILQVAKKYGYQKNLFAEALVSGVSKDVGLVVPTMFESPYYRDFYVKSIAGMMEGLRNTENKLRIIFLREKPEIEEVLGDINSMKLRGVVLSPYCYDFLLSEKEIRNIGVPVVVLGKKVEGKNVTAIYLDDEEGGCEGTKYLIGLGHKKIGVIRGFRDDIERRYAGYLRAMKEYSLKVVDKFVVQGDGLSGSGYSLTIRMLKGKIRPTAIFALDDEMAYGAMNAIKDLGLNVPRDISVLGYDGIEIGEFMDPPLTTLNRPVKEMARKALEVITGDIKETGRDIVIKPKVVKRRSCA